MLVHLFFVLNLYLANDLYFAGYLDFVYLILHAVFFGDGAPVLHLPS